MKKRFITLLFAASLIGCGTKPAAPSVTTDTTVVSTPGTVETQAPAEQTSEAGFNTSGTIEEQTLYEGDGVLVKALSLEYERSRAKLLIAVENNSSRQVTVLSGTMGLSCNGVNGWMVHDGWINVDVPAGKKANDTAYFDYAPMLACGIKGIETLFMTLQLEYDGDYSTKFTAEPVAIKTSLAEGNDEDLPFDQVATGLMNVYSTRTLQFYDDTELFNSSGIRVPSAAYFTDAENRKYLVLELVNESDQVLDVDSSNISANGFSLCSSRWSSSDILPEKRDYMTLELTSMKDKDDWEAMGITDVSDISLDLGVRNLDYDYIAQPSTILIHVSDAETNTAEETGTELYSENGVRIVSKGLVKDSLYVKWKLLIENSNDFEIVVSDGWGDKLSINDYMIDYLMWSEYVGANQSSIAEIEIDIDSLEAAGIDADNLGVAEMELEIKDENYNDLGSPVIRIDFSTAD